MERFAWATPERVAEMDDHMLALLIAYDNLRHSQEAQAVELAALGRLA